MRSELVFHALKTIQNRYLLCQAASKATRRFHRPNTRIQETMNEVMDRISTAEVRRVVGEKQVPLAQPQRRAA